TLEEGKTLPESRGEVALAAETFRFHAGMAKTSTERIFPSPTPGETIRTVRSPLGVVGVITPWNFPIQIPAWKIAPALAAGNTVVWKPASNTPLLAVALARILHEAGFPPGVVNLVLGPGSMGQAIVDDERVHGITFTGSVPVGVGIRDAVTARNGRVQLELGGHNPAIVCDDADLDLAVPAIVAGAMGATGQKCTATRRIIATPGIRDELTDRLISAVSALQVGDGMHAGIGIGPLVSPGARAEVAEAYDAAVAEGAEILAAAEAPAGDCFFAPTLFAGSPDLSLGRDEVFGPLSLVIAADSDDEAFAVGLTCGGTIHLFLERFEPGDWYVPLKADIASGQAVALATVIDGPGVGNKLLVRADDSVIGTLGHENLDRVVERDARGELAAGRSGLRHYGEHGEAREDIVAVFIESFAPPPQMLIFGAVDFT
ncbi:MAG: aldehyde dehydrogenase family protein, partial [Actinobacteria bacterium]|nr:aldehyde dehydrogenase family protein [Actinomycetota bacterium]